ncbi:ArsR family transcriptional regulator [Candidatus Micrarchaeota archaeon]|nr:ArsR family transcriptional regulator [Candidatus Micrarchaeota archaeon]
MWNLVSFVKRGKIRREVLKILSINPRTPTELAKETKFHRSAVSRALLDLESKGLVTCLTPKEKLGRLYQATEKGKQVLAKLAKISVENNPRHAFK